MVSVDNAPLDVTRHEVAHIVTGVATKGPFGIASWLNEGISVFSQTHILENEQSALDDAISRDRVLSMKELNSSASGRSGSTVSLFYAESGAIVKFLVDTYGPEKFAQLLKVFKDGSTPDDAFKTVYGLDQLGVENAWRQSVGLQPHTAAEATAPAATAPASASQPTSRTGTTAPSSNDNSSSGDSHVLLIALIFALALVAVALAAGGVVVVRRRL